MPAEVIDSFVSFNVRVIWAGVKAEDDYKLKYSIVMCFSTI